LERKEVIKVASKRKTTQIKVYKADLEQVRLRFPDATMPQFFHIAVRTNPLLQVEAMLRGKRKKR